MKGKEALIELIKTIFYIIYIFFLVKINIWCYNFVIDYIRYEENYNEVIGYLLISFFTVACNIFYTVFMIMVEKTIDAFR